MNPTVYSSMGKIVELYYRPVFGFAARLCGNPLRAVVLTQHTFRVALERSSNRLPVPSDVRAWLITILFHQFLRSRPHAVGD